MASDPGLTLRPSDPDDSAASARLPGGRAKPMQRLQIGLCGLAAMVLLVGLANVIISKRQLNEAQVVPEAAATSAVKSGPPASDPLADAGVVPNMPDTQAAAPGDADTPLP